MDSITVLTRAQARELDRLAAAAGVPGRVLMENAGAGVARFILDLLAQGLASAPVAVLCGGGHNGGDGYVVARHLHAADVPLSIWEWSTIDSLPPDAGANARCLAGPTVERQRLPRDGSTEGLGRALAASGLVVDGLLGTGFQGSLRPDLEAVLREVGRCAAPILAIDLPSGLDADTGAVAPGTPGARWTLALAALKPALVAPAPLAGEVHCLPIGLPPGVLQAALDTSKVP